MTEQPSGTLGEALGSPYAEEGTEYLAGKSSRQQSHARLIERVNSPGSEVAPVLEEFERLAVLGLVDNEGEVGGRAAVVCVRGSGVDCVRLDTSSSWTRIANDTLRREQKRVRRRCDIGWYEWSMNVHTDTHRPREGKRPKCSRQHSR